MTTRTITDMQRDMMARAEVIAKKHGVEVSTYPGPFGRITISTYDDSELPAELEDALEREFASFDPIGGWPITWGYRKLQLIRPRTLRKIHSGPAGH